LVVGALFVLHGDVLLELLFDGSLQIFLIPSMSVSFDLISDFRVLLENVFQKELFGKSKAFHSFFTLENKLTPKVVDNVVIADNKHLNKLPDSFEIVSSLSARAKEIPN
tara:strand:+ start:230 stop:556 length:327 start_codon:yes stop_codon:yes gene_type:complete